MLAGQLAARAEAVAAILSGDSSPVAAPESSGTPRPFIDATGVRFAVPDAPPGPFMTVATVTASTGTLAAAAAVKEGAEPGEDAPEQEPAPATQVIDAASMHTQTMTAITPAVSGEGDAA